MQITLSPRFSKVYLYVYIYVCKEAKATKNLSEIIFIFLTI